jgi:predicted oxidoreductase
VRAALGTLYRATFKPSAINPNLCYNRVRLETVQGTEANYALEHPIVGRLDDRRACRRLRAPCRLSRLPSRTLGGLVVPACLHYGVGIIPWSPLASGLLGGILKGVQEGRRASEGVQKMLEKYRDRIERYEAFCEELGEEPANVALAWLLQQPAVTAPIIGPRTLEQLDRSMRALEIRLDEDALKRLDEIFPGPGGPAPEAYAW